MGNELLQCNGNSVTNVTEKRNTVTQCNAPTIPNLTIPYTTNKLTANNNLVERENSQMQNAIYV